MSIERRYTAERFPEGTFTDAQVPGGALRRRDVLRGLFSWTGGGLGTAAFLSLLSRDGLLASEADGASGAAPASSGRAARAKRVIHICLCGGLSHIDSFDYKPALAHLHGKSLQTDERPDVFFGRVGLLRQSDWQFRRRGASGRWMSDLFPYIGGVADELTMIHSMFAESSSHTPATFQENTGFRFNGFPVLGSWVSYGLGTENDELPAYVVLPDSRGLPAGTVSNWTNGFLPGRHQGVPFRSEGAAIRDLNPAREIAPQVEERGRSLLAKLNQLHLDRRGSEDSLVARMHAYELAARMQLAVPDVTAVRTETQATRDLYGLERDECLDFGGRCLLARRLVERGVRFVQLFSGGAFGSPRINWDGHEDMVRNHTREAARVDQPIAGLLRDLRQRGLLDETLVLFTSEFGRTPFTQSGDNTVGTGRDHNQEGFTVWLAGAGLRRGASYGATDDVGYRAVKDRVHWNDFHATVLHLMGIDHEHLTYYHNGIQRRLTNVGGNVLRDILA
jgi:hypothetical protein